MRISVSRLEFTYPNRTFRLAIPRLDIERGSATAFIGASGSGKTTLLRLISGIYTPDSGEITLDDIEMTSLDDPARRRFRISSIGFVFQDFQLIEYLDVEENIRIPYRIHPAMQWDDTASDHLDILLDSVRISDKRNRTVDTLSHGEKQRVAICRSLIASPGLVLADEPTGNLDADNKHNILNILFEETRKRGATLVMVTHDRELLDGFDQVIDFQSFHRAGEG